MPPPVRVDEEPIMTSWEQLALPTDEYAGMIMQKHHIEPIEDET